MTKQGGGVIIIESDKLQVREANNETPDEAAVLALEVKTQEGDFNLGNIYTPPWTRTWGKDEHKKMKEDKTPIIRKLLQNAEHKKKKDDF